MACPNAAATARWMRRHYLRLSRGRYRLGVTYRQTTAAPTLLQGKKRTRIQGDDITNWAARPKLERCDLVEELVNGHIGNNFDPSLHR